MGDEHEPQPQLGATAPLKSEQKELVLNLDSDPLVGTLLADRYQIVSLIGRGGMSAVYKAEHMYMKRFLALKILYTHLAKDQSALKRFEQEAWIAGAFVHPNVVQVHDFGIDPRGQVYLAMDYVDGRNLADELQIIGRMSYPRAISIFKKVASGLGAAHNAGVLHRDMKPSNIMLCDKADGEDDVKIVDFGIAKVLDASGDSIQRLTHTGEVFGSPLYMSPEQCQGKVLDKRSDIYSLGCVFYETLTGSPVHLGENALETMRKHISEIPRPFAKVAPESEIPPRLEEIVFRMLEKNPSDRYADLSEVERDLQWLSKNPAINSPSLKGQLSGVRREIIRQADGLKKAMSVLLVGIIVSIFLANYAYPSYIKMSWQKQYNDGDKLYEAGKLKDAEAKLTEALALARKLNDHGGAESKTLELLVPLYKKMGNYANMIEARARQDDIIQTQLNKDYGVTGDELKRLANSTLSQAPEPGVKGANRESFEEAIYRLNAAAALCNLHGHSDYAEKLIKRAIDLRESTSGKNAAGLPELYGTLANACVHQRKFQEAEKYFERQLETSRASGGNDKSGLVLAMCNMIRVYTAKANFKEGEALAKEALQTAESAGGNNGDLVKTCLEDYAALLRAGDRDEEAAILEKRADAIHTD